MVILRGCLEVSGVSSTESRPPCPIPPKRSFADFDEPDPSSSQLGTTKRLRIETEEAEQEAKFVQTVQQQPTPHPLKRSHARFLEDLVDPLPSSPALKRYCLASVDSFVTQWVESASESESYRERHCRSDILLGHLDSDIIPRRLTMSAPNMEYKRDADGFNLPPTPTSTNSQLYRANSEDLSVTPSDVSGASVGSSRKKSLVEDPFYRSMNLATNNIYMRDVDEEFPEYIASLVDHVRKVRDSPDPSSDQLRHDADLHQLEKGAGESAVENYFKANVFPNPKSSDSLQRIDKNPMAKLVVPDIGSKLKVSTPAPNLLYGYSRNGKFTDGQQAQLISMGTEMVANSQDLIYPFFVIEFKADGPGGSGSLWVATNQCLGGSASCVNIAERLNCLLRHCKSDEVQPIDSAAFSIAMNGTEARLYVSWKHDELKLYMRKVKSFLLQEPEQYIEFRKHVRNIIDWGKDKRLKEIQKSLDSLLEESRKIASQLAKSRPPPSNVSASSSSHKRKDSSSRRRNNRTTTVQEYPSDGTNAQGNNQDESLVQTRAADSVYVPPYASIPASDQDDPSMQISIADHEYTSLAAPYPLITPPQSSKDITST